MDQDDIPSEKPKRKGRMSVFTFRNTTRNNIFTEAGRCAPGNTVELRGDLAEQYKGLEKC